jgi:hypothetical protein
VEPDETKRMRVLDVAELLEAATARDGTAPGKELAARQAAPAEEKGS